MEKADLSNQGERAFNCLCGGFDSNETLIKFCKETQFQLSNSLCAENKVI